MEWNRWPEFNPSDPTPKGVNPKICGEINEREVLGRSRYGPCPFTLYVLSVYLGVIFEAKGWLSAHTNVPNLIFFGQLEGRGWLLDG